MADICKIQSSDVINHFSATESRLESKDGSRLAESVFDARVICGY